MCLSILKKFTGFKGYSLQLESTAGKNLEANPGKKAETNPGTNQEGVVEADKEEKKNVITQDIEFEEMEPKTVEKENDEEKEESEGSVELM